MAVGSPATRLESPSDDPGATMRAARPSSRSRPAAVWLALVAVLILAMVVVGGATRATGSGLSITQWDLITGVLPPLSGRAWGHVFHLYQATPQYRLLNSGMDLAQFRYIFWWEWSHRLLGRALGVVFLIPFIVLLAVRRLPRRLIWRCVALFVFGGVQGAVGWWMVESGLEARTSVAPERLATHLGLALVLFVATLWTALEAWSGPARHPQRSHRRWRWATSLFACGVFVQCLLGALVAGNHAGLIDADWPLMGGRWFPADYWRGSIWTTFAHGRPAVQFNHRMWAYALFASGLLLAFATFRRQSAASNLRPLASLLVLLLTFQLCLGVAALIYSVPLTLALAHQFTAVTILALATLIAWRVRRLHR